MNKKSVISSLAYKFLETFAVKGIGIIISVILARLITPEEFGQVAIMTVFINLSITFIQSGLNSALVQKKNIDDSDYSTVFYISISIAVLMVTILNLAAPIIAEFYDCFEIVTPLRLYAFSLLFGAFNSVQVAKLQREMRFKTMMYCNLASTIISGIIGLSAAFLGLGIWALIIYYFSNTVVSCFLMLFAVKWLPKLVFSVERAKSLFSYGWKMLFSAVLSSLYNDLRSLVIGKKFSSESLAFYDRGKQFPNIVSNTTDSAIQSVMFPTLAAAQDDRVQLKSMLRRTMTMGFFIIAPIVIGMAVVADNLVVILFGEQWIPAIAYMQIICIAEAHLPLTSSNLILVKAMGRSDLYMRFEIIRRIAMVIVLLISVFCFGSVKAIAIGYAISAWLDVCIVIIPMKKIIGYGFFEQIKDIWKIIFATIVMSVVAIAVGKIALPIYLSLIFKIIVGIFTYVILSIALRIEIFYYTIGIIKKSFFKK